MELQKYVGMANYVIMVISHSGELANLWVVQIQEKYQGMSIFTQEWQFPLLPVLRIWIYTAYVGPT